jgi:hypothetical protein
MRVKVRLDVSKPLCQGRKTLLSFRKDDWSLSNMRDSQTYNIGVEKISQGDSGCDV